MIQPKNLKLREKIGTAKKHWVRLTRTCNNRCLFCLDNGNQNSSFVPLDAIIGDLQEGRRLKTDRVILSGGEPTVHPDFLDIITRAKKLGYTHIQAITNGRMFAYSDFLNKAVASGISEITFSMHGHNSHVHDLQTQVKGSFKQSLSGLINALEIKKLIVSVDVVINKINIKHLPDILKFFIELDVGEFDLLQVVPFGLAWDNRDKLFYDIEESAGYLNKAFVLSKSPLLHIWTNRFPPRYLEGFEYLIQHPFKLFDEINGRKGMFKQFLSKGVAMDCAGERCLNCFLGQFCKDLQELKNNGRLSSHEMPPCLKNMANLIHAYKKIEFVLSAASDEFITDFVDFFIEHRYFIKSLRCVKCRKDSVCHGLQCKNAIKYGFKILKPLN